MLWMVALSYANLSWFCSLIGGKWRHPERRARIHKIETSSPIKGEAYQLFQNSSS